MARVTGADIPNDKEGRNRLDLYIWYWIVFFKEDFTGYNY